MTAVGLGQRGSPGEGPGPSLCRGKYFYDFTGICQKFHSNGYHGTVGSTTGFWSGRYGFESQPSRKFLINTTENLDTPSLLPPSFFLNFLLLEILWNTAHKGSPTKFFGTARQKIFYRKSSFSPLRHKVFRYPKLSEGFLYEMFWYCETKQVWRKIVIPAASYPQHFSIPEFSETQKGSSSKCFDTVRQNNFDGKSWYPPPLLSPTFFDIRNFLKHRRVPLRIFSALWDKSFLTENRDTL